MRKVGLLPIASGAWSLVTTTYKKPTATLAEGHLTMDWDKWHKFALSMQEDRIIVSVERKQLADVYDGSHARGFGMTLLAHATTSSIDPTRPVLKESSRAIASSP